MYIGQRILAWVLIIMGSLALFGTLTSDVDGYTILGGMLFLTSGVVILQLVKKVEKYEKEM